MVDKVHCRPDDHASRTFRQNRKHFVEGEDFYLIEFSQKGEFHRYGISVPPRGLIVLTESGYLLLVKSFTDDLAWQVQKQLIKVYFRANAQVAPAAAPPIPVLYEKITREQVAELTQGVNRAFYASIQPAPQAQTSSISAIQRMNLRITLYLTGRSASIMCLAG